MLSEDLPPRPVELVYDTACPNVDNARALLRSALTAVGLRSEWKEWDRDADETPLSRRAFGSPTILVAGRDVAVAEGASYPLPMANSCRLYVHDGGGGMHGVPPINLVLAALRRENAPNTA